jgi:hypothetical protein
MGDIITYDQEIVMIIETALQSAGIVGNTVKHISNGWHNRTLEALDYLRCTHCFLKVSFFLTQYCFIYQFCIMTLICLLYSHIGHAVTGGTSSMVSLRRRRLLGLCSGKAKSLS